MSTATPAELAEQVRVGKRAGRELRKQRQAERPKVAAKIAHRRAEPVAPGQRKPRQRDNAYLAATRREPCLIGLVVDGCSGPIDPAHLRFSDAKRGRINPGKGAKPDDKWVNPLCRAHHEQQHARGNEDAFWVEHGFDDIGAVCEARYAAFVAGENTTEVLIYYADLARRGMTP